MGAAARRHVDFTHVSLIKTSVFVIQSQSFFFISNVLSSLLSAEGEFLLDKAGPDVLRNREVRLPANVSVVVPASGKSGGVEGHWDGGGKEEQAGQDNKGEQKSCHFGG